MIKFFCPHCSQKISGADDVLGTPVECPNCNQQFVAQLPPGETPPAPAPPAPAPPPLPAPAPPSPPPAPAPPFPPPPAAPPPRPAPAPKKQASAADWPAVPPPPWEVAAAAARAPVKQRSGSGGGKFFVWLFGLLLGAAAGLMGAVRYPQLQQYVSFAAAPKVATTPQPATPTPAPAKPPVTPANEDKVVDEKATATPAPKPKPSGATMGEQPAEPASMTMKE